jgi:hypothetical protein
VRAIARAVDRTARKTADLDTQVRQLAADLARLAGLLTTPAPAAGAERPSTGSAGEQAGEAPGADRPDDPPAPRSWLLAADPAQATADLADLAGWVARVYVRYSRAQLSSCWLWHPEVIEELWWLRCAHADAYHPETGSWLRVGDWHDRQRPGVERRLNALLGKCSLSRHIDRHGRPADVGEPAPPPLAAHHPAVAAAWTATGTAGPQPDEELLAQAQRAEYDQHRGSR